MKNLEEFKEWLEKEIEVWEQNYDLENADNQNKLILIYGRLKELERIKEFINK